MMIHKITPSVDYNYWLKRLYTLLSLPTNSNSIKVRQHIRKCSYKTLGTSVINSPMYPSDFTGMALSKVAKHIIQFVNDVRQIKFQCTCVRVKFCLGIFSRIEERLFSLRQKYLNNFSSSKT